MPGAVLGEDEVRKLLEAGRVAAEARDYAARLVEAGASARSICERVESFIRDRGAEPAFPCNISVNDVAAHYTPGALDDLVIPEDAVVKLDVGAHVDGFIADTAVTVDLSGRHDGLLDAAREALERAAAAVKPYARVYDVSRAIYQAIRARGFRPIRNLSGHTIARYVIHAGVNVPNHPDRSTAALRLAPGTVVAIEPFATNGRGLVVEGSTVNIYAYTGRRPRASLNEAEEAALKLIAGRYRTLPFTPRWLARDMGGEEAERAVRGLAAKKALHQYPVLVESGGGLVAQFEHTFIILRDGVLVSTAGRGEA